MKSLSPLVALLALACGAAATDPELEAPASSEASGDVSPAAAPTATRTRAARPLPEPEAVEYRTCSTDTECELRTSACLPLVTGGPSYCRQPMAEQGAACERAEDCEVGLECLRVSGASSCQPCGAAATAYAPARACERVPLACDREGGEAVQDADCEVAPSN